jgi:Flp pilus assembly protein TadD/L-ascorbate metabolism protein UlaG (beta-lactamase superfamily)
VTSEEFENICYEAGALNYEDKRQEALNKLVSILDEGIDNEVYKLCIESNIAYYLNNNKEAVDISSKAITLGPDMPEVLTNHGYILNSANKDYDGSIEFYEKALAIDPNHARALNNTASKLQDDPATIKKALNRINKAVELAPTRALYWRTKSIISYRTGGKKDSYKAILEASKLQSDSKKIATIASYIFSKLSDADKTELGVEENPPDTTNVGGLKGFIQTVREEFKDTIARFEKQKEESEKHLLDFIGNDSKLDKNRSIFLVLRKWNSFTPALPIDDGEKSVGGGYFIYHHGVGTVIDPGYNFIENFYKAGCRLVDIDNIIITHAHNDHTIDFESILTLLHQAHKEKVRQPKLINLYLNQGALLKFSSLLDWRSKKYIGNISTINAGDTYQLNDGSTVLTALPAYHDEIVTRYYSVGLHFSFTFEDNEKRNILLTSDTGLYPPKEKNDIGDVLQLSTTEIHELYKNIDENLVNDIDLLIPHLGSIGKNELCEIENMDWEPENILYGNHLGVLGVLRLISSIKPNLALVSEFGEELKTFRGELIQLMQKVIEKVLPEGNINILPADLPFFYDVKERSAFCVDTEQMEDVTKIKFEQENDTFYYYCDDEKRKNFTCLKERFDNTRRRPHLKSDC